MRILSQTRDELEGSVSILTFHCELWVQTQGKRLWTQIVVISFVWMVCGGGEHISSPKDMRLPLMNVTRPGVLRIPQEQQENMPSKEDVRDMMNLLPPRPDPAEAVHSQEK